MATAKFAPRRLGHVNLWVSDLERSIDFYESVCGIELVRRERDIKIGFHSNGNTHHDVGMVETSKGVDRYGRNGLLQIPKTRGLAPGLNHLGWEMESEAELVDAFRRAQSSNLPVARTVDHLISHSVYLNDPDGNGHEFYADEMKDWWSVYNLGREDEVTSDWNPLAKQPKQDANYNTEFKVRRVERAPVHPSHLTDACIATRNFGPMKDFFVDVAGLRQLRETSNGRRSATFAGAVGRPDLTLLQVGTSDPVGLHSFSFVLADDLDVAQAVKTLTANGVQASAAGGARPGVEIRDPDGFRILFHSEKAQ